jgi:hypothetical protein
MTIRLLLILLLAASPASADDDYQALAEKAIEAISQDFGRYWAFTETRLEEDVLWIGRYDPRRPEDERWQLISVDGREPNDDEIEEYLDDQDEPEDSGDNKVEAMVQADTLKLVEETAEHWLFEFVPDGDDDNFLAHVNATMKIVKADEPYVTYVDLRSNKAFKPAMGVKLKEFLTRLTFAPVDADGPVVPHSVDVKVRGRAFLVISFDETVSIRYSDYEYVNDDSPVSRDL